MLLGMSLCASQAADIVKEPVADRTGKQTMMVVASTLPRHETVYSLLGSGCNHLCCGTASRACTNRGTPYETLQERLSKMMKRIRLNECLLCVRGGRDNLSLAHKLLTLCHRLDPNG